MITELLGLAGSGFLGSIAGVISDIIERKQQRKYDEVLLEIKREDARNGITSEHTREFANSSQFGYCVGIIVITYCACCILCLCYPSYPILTFNPDDAPKKLDLLLFSFEWQNTKVYSISTGGVGYALLHPLAFQIGTVITGIRPNR